MSDFEHLDASELRLRDLEAMVMMLGCELRVHRKMLGSLIGSETTMDGKTPDQYFRQTLRKERETLLATLSDQDPSRASWFARYIRDRMREDPQ